MTSSADSDSEWLS